jgi:spermidine/putrescine transport system permease protein
MATVAPPPAAQHDIAAEAHQEKAVLGRGGPPLWLRKAGRGLLSVWSIIVLLYLFTPILVVVVYSFNQPVGSYNYKWDQFSLNAWTDPFRYDELQEALFYSLRIAVVVTVISTLIGTSMALAMVKYRFKAKGFLGTMLVLPLTLPEVVLGFSLLTLFVAMAWQRGFVTIVIAQVMFSISYVALTVRARIRGFDWRLEEAALDLGAPPLRTFLKITLPIITPGIVAAALLTFALSLDDFIITYLNSGIDETFPIAVWITKRSRIPPQINVISTMILVVSVAVAVSAVAVGGRRAKKLGQA